MNENRTWTAVFDECIRVFPGVSVAVRDKQGLVVAGNLKGDVWCTASVPGEAVSFLFSGQESFSPEFARLFVSECTKHFSPPQTHPRKNETELFVDQLFFSDPKANHFSLTLLAARLLFNPSISRVVCFGSVSGSGNANRIALDTLANLFGKSPDNLFAIRESGQLLACLTQCQRATLSQQLNRAVKILKERHEIVLHLGVGITVNKLSFYGIGLQTAQIALASLRENESVGFFDACLAPYLMTCLPQNLLDHFFRDEVKVLGNEMPVVEALVDNDMNLAGTAYALRMHRNTLIKHIATIRSLILLNPLHVDEDRFHLALLSAYYKHNK